VRGVIDIIVKQNEEVKGNVNTLRNFLFQILNSYIFESNKLSEREIEILRVRFKINIGSNKGTLQEVADKFDLTRERIRQIESRLPRKIAVLVNKAIKEFKIDFSNYTSPNYFFVNEEYAKNVNEIEGTEFSLSFVILILSSIFKFGLSYLK
jgi:hypothetical protein